MTSKKRKKREKLYSIYSDNLSIYCPHISNQFLCPLCRELFTKLDLDNNEITEAHIIPKSVGGRLSTITCKKCNNDLGTRYDRHIKLLKNLYDWKDGKAVDGCDIIYNNEIIPTYANIDLRNKRGPTMIFRPVAEKEPNYPKFLNFATAETDGKANFDGLKFDIKRKGNPDLGKLNMSFLHSALLMMFHYFGYEYILSNNIDNVRRILNDTNSDKYTNIVSFYRGVSFRHPLPAIGVLNEPQEIQSFLVALLLLNIKDCVIIVALPGFDEEGKEKYNNLMKQGMPRDPRIIDAKWINFNKGYDLNEPLLTEFCKLIWRTFTTNQLELGIKQVTKGIYLEVRDET